MKTGLSNRIISSGQPGAKSKLIYQNLEDLLTAIRKTTDIEHFDTSCFDGKYVTGDIDESYLTYINSLRNDVSREIIEDGNVVMELHNN